MYLIAGLVETGFNVKRSALSTLNLPERVNRRGMSLIVVAIDREGLLSETDGKETTKRTARSDKTIEEGSRFMRQFLHPYVC